MKTTLWILTFFFSFSFLSLANDQTVSEEKKIEELITAIEKSDLIFIRNGDEHPAPKAANHLREKLKAGQNSWFAPKKSEWTARLFIEKIASKSSVSGKSYFVKFPDGTKVEAGKWFFEKLETIEKRPASLPAAK